MMTDETPRTAYTLVDALAYALARAPLPDRETSSRAYAERLALYVIESGWAAAAPPTYTEVERLDRPGNRANLEAAPPEPRHTEGQGEVCDPSCPHWGWAENRAAPPEPPRPDLRQWVRHPLTCDAAYDRPGLHECSCGLSEALAGLAAPQGQPLDVDAIYEALWAERDRLDAGTGGFNESLYRRAARAILARLSESGSPGDDR